MKLRLIAALAAAAALIGAALLLLLPINATYSGVQVGCGTVFNPDTTKAENTDQLGNLGDHGFKAACDDATTGRLGWGIGLGVVGVAAAVGAGVVRPRRSAPVSTPPAAAA
ncbi:hypothetical protein [Amycolatopsis sp. NPDC004378]